MNPAPITYTHDGTTYEGFRPYQGESDAVNIRKLYGPKRYALVIAIVSSSSPISLPGQSGLHTVWTVIDTNLHTTAFNKFLREHYPSVTFIRFLRSRT